MVINISQSKQKGILMEQKNSRQEKELKALYKGKLPIGNLIMDCAVLSDGTRILTKGALYKAFNKIPRGWHKERKEKMQEELQRDVPSYNLSQPPFFISTTALIPYITEDLLKYAQPIKYIDGRKIAEGYNAKILFEICNLYLKARRDSSLNARLEDWGRQAEIIVTSFAKVGIVALIDEATGYQYDRKHDALRVLLEQYISEGLQKWVKKFPDEFFIQLDRLYNNEKTTPRRRPKYYGNFINTYIYNPIEDGYVKKELDKKNIGENGKRKACFHQWLTEFGNNQLVLQIGRVMGVMEMSTNIQNFKRKISRQKNLAIQPALFDIEEYQD